METALQVLGGGQRWEIQHMLQLPVFVNGEGGEQWSRHQGSDVHRSLMTGGPLGPGLTVPYRHSQWLDPCYMCSWHWPLPLTKVDVPLTLAPPSNYSARAAGTGPAL